MQLCCAVFIQLYVLGQGAGSLSYNKAHRWLVLLGVLASTLQMVPQARLYMRPFQLYLQSRWNRAVQCLEYLITVNQDVFNYQWWMDQA